MTTHEGEVARLLERAVAAQNRGTTSLFDEVVAALRAASKREAEGRAWEIALLELTPGGSEFVDDPKRCARHVTGRFEQTRQIIFRMVEDRNALRTALEAADALAATVKNDGLDEWVAYGRARRALTPQATEPKPDESRNWTDHTFGYLAEDEGATEPAQEETK